MYILKSHHCWYYHRNNNNNIIIQFAWILMPLHIVIRNQPSTMQRRQEHITLESSPAAAAATATSTATVMATSSSSTSATFSLSNSRHSRTMYGMCGCLFVGGTRFHAYIHTYKNARIQHIQINKTSGKNCYLS